MLMNICRSRSILPQFTVNYLHNDFFAPSITQLNNLNEFKTKSLNACYLWNYSSILSYSICTNSIVSNLMHGGLLEFPRMFRVMSTSSKIFFSFREVMWPTEVHLKGHQHHVVRSNMNNFQFNCLIFDSNIDNVRKNKLPLLYHTIVSPARTLKIKVLQPAYQHLLVDDDDRSYSNSTLARKILDLRS